MKAPAFGKSALIAGLAAALLSGTAAAQSPRIVTLSEQQVLDMMVGTSIQASRSSDSAELQQRAREAMAQGKQFMLIAPEDLPDDWMVISPGAVGGGGAWEYVLERTKKQKRPEITDGAVRSIEALSRHIGKKFNAVIRVEAAGATLGALLAGADLGVPVVDACLSGRARPETQQQIPWINGIPSTPAAMATLWGDIVILEKTIDDYRSEDLGRGIAVSSGGGAWMALTPMTGAEVKRGTIHGAVTQAILLGKTVREAAARKQDPVDALIKVVNGYKLFHGTVTQADTKGERGFTWSNVELQGIGPFAGHTYRVFVKNENLVTWFDGQVDATSPDFIQNLNPKTGDAIKHAELGGYTLGEDVVMIGWPASNLWRTPRGIEVFGPRHFGFDIDYVPIENYNRCAPSRLLKSRSNVPRGRCPFFRATSRIR